MSAKPEAAAPKSGKAEPRKAPETQNRDARKALDNHPAKKPDSGNRVPASKPAPQNAAPKSGDANKASKPQSRVPQRKIVDTRKGGDVNLAKYDERLEDLGGQRGERMQQRAGKEKFRDRKSVV